MQYIVPGALIPKYSTFFVILWLVLKINIFYKVYLTCKFCWKSTFRTFACMVLYMFCFSVGQWVNETEQGIDRLQFQHEVLVKIILTSFVIVNSLLLLVWDILDVVNFAETSQPSKKYNQLTKSTSDHEWVFCLFLTKSLVAKSLFKLVLRPLSCSAAEHEADPRAERAHPAYAGIRHVCMRAHAKQ